MKDYREYCLIALSEIAVCRLVKTNRIQNYLYVSAYKEFGIKVTLCNIAHDSISGGHSY